MVGKGGEGKSRAGLIFQEIFEDSMNTRSLQKVETDRFARADLEYKLVQVDDDMRMEALPSTNNVKGRVLPPPASPDYQKQGGRAGG